MSADEMVRCYFREPLDYLLNGGGSGLRLQDGGFVPACDVTLDYLCRILSTVDQTGDSIVLPRKEAETLFTHRHISTYCVQNFRGLVAVYRRGKSGGESRLHDKLSIGVGGHVVEEVGVGGPITPEYAFATNNREVYEELELAPYDAAGISWRDRYIGAIAASDTDVDRVHLGLVFERSYRGQYIDGTMPPSAKEDCLRDLQWKWCVRLKGTPPEEGTFETWSGLVLGRMYNVPTLTYF